MKKSTITFSRPELSDIRIDKAVSFVRKNIVSGLEETSYLLLRAAIAVSNKKLEDKKE